MANIFIRRIAGIRTFAIFMFWSIPCVFGGPLPANSQIGQPPGAPTAPAKKEIASEMEIKKLIGNLGNGDFRIRAKSTDRLKEIGLPALQYLEDAFGSADLETRLRAEALVAAIRTANRLPTKVSGLEFKVLVSTACASGHHRS